MIGLARRLLAVLLPADVRATMLAELDDEYARTIRPSRGAGGAARWYWMQVAGSILPALAMRRRRHGGPGRWIVEAAQDARVGVRLLGRQKLFTATVVTTLALGLGTTTAMFGLVDGVLLRPLPYQDPDRLIRIWSANPRGIPRNQISPADFFDWREQVRGLSGLSGFFVFDITLTSGGEPIRLSGAAATSDLAATLGVHPLLGRWFVETETRGDGERVTVISEALWRTRFGGDGAIVGQSIEIDGQLRTITGVMPQAFQWPSGETRVWLPLADALRGRPRSARYLGAVGRLAPGATFESARDSLVAAANRLAADYPDADRGWGVTVAPLADAVLGDVRTPLLVLLAAVVAVLLIACANVTSLLVARGVSRSRELAVRAAVGASAGRLLRMQLVETMLLSVIGGALGIALASWFLQAVHVTRGLRVPMLDRVALDGRVVACAFAVTLICALVTGAWPAWKSSRARGGDALTSGSRTTSGQVRVRQAIVLVQIAVATALVAAGALLVTSFLRLTAVPTGFTADRTLLADVSLPAVRYPRQTQAPFFARLLERIRALPGVESAGAGGPLPLSGLDGLLRFAVRVEGGDHASDRRAYLRWATPGYFEAMGIEVRSGRAFSEGDTDRSTPVVVIDGEFARRFFPDQNPIGKRVGTPIDAKTWREIVGVVAPVRQSALDREVEPHLYFPESQVPSAELTLVVRSTGDATALTPGVRHLLRDLDAALPLANVRPLTDLVASSAAPRRIGALLLSVFAGLALLLTLVGVYGVVSQVVAQSTRELGVRIALGATRADVMSLVVLRAVRIALAGVLVGAVLAWLAAPALRAMLYGVGPRDPWTLVAAASALTVATAVAAWVPARRILRLDVVNALRVE